MSLDVYLTDTNIPAVEDQIVYSGNITHNLTDMAREAGIYKHLWRPEELAITKAIELQQPLAGGLCLLLSEPDRFKKLNASNGWGTHIDLCRFVACYLLACIQHPTADVSVSR